MNLYKTIFCISFFCSILLAQPSDSVDVTFYYDPPGSPANVYLPGEFNGWTINNPSTRMTLDPVTGIWSKIIRLRVGGPNPLPAPFSIPGAYQYKFHADGTWSTDPFNPRQNLGDNNNSYLFIKNPTVHYLLPNSTQEYGIVRVRYPLVTAYLYPSVLTSIDTSTISIILDEETQYNNIGYSYDPLNKKLSYLLPDPVEDGQHQLILSVQSSAGTISTDTTNFIVQANIIQIFTLPSETWKDSWRIQGGIFNSSGDYDTSITSAQIIRFDSTWTVSVSDGKVDTTIFLLEGNNIFRLQADISGGTETSDSLVIIRKVNHNPFALIDINQNGNILTVSGASSSDPDGQQLEYLWKEDPNNQTGLGLEGQTLSEIMISKPSLQGEYYFSLEVKDTDLNLDSTRAYFVVETDSPNVKIAGFDDNPEWVKNARIYQLFFKAFTPTGTIKSAIPNLEYIKAMGFNVIWVLPVTEIPGNVDNQVNIGYSIIDFENVESSYGTNEDYKDFINEAHKLGIKVIQDITPNHTARLHPFAQEALQFGDFSQYWNYYQTHFISHNNNGLGDCVTSEGIWYYCAFSDGLLNYNWSDLDARNYMIDVYDNWISEFGIDGYRFDIYWGPLRKYGKQNMGVPVRTSLKHIKPDLLLLGEDDGVGTGTELLYADQGGGLDVAYDSRLYFDAIRDFAFNSAGVNTLHSKLDNNGYHPGENSYFLRFMENQDEDRISYEYNSFEKTMPIATSVFMAPGIPQIFNGQEVGFGKGMGTSGEPDLNDRRRGIIDWNFGGKNLLQPHYQRLAQIRAQFPAFSQHRMDTNGDGQVTNQDESDFDRVNTNNGIVYSFLRPYLNSNGLTVMNFSNSSQNVSLDLTTYNLKFSDDFNPSGTYWINNLYDDTSYQIIGSELGNFSVNLPAYSSKVFTISNQSESVDIPPLPNIVSVDNNYKSKTDNFELLQNYPNPFNPTTNIEFRIANPGFVSLKVYDILGREIKTLVNEELSNGIYKIDWNGDNESGEKVSSGIYFYRIETGSFVNSRKMILMK